jgi:hypothetical protein
MEQGVEAKEDGLAFANLIAFAGSGHFDSPGSAQDRAIEHAVEGIMHLLRRMSVN